MLAYQDQPDEAEQDAGTTGPQPHSVIGTAQPTPERQQDHKSERPHGSTGQDHTSGIDLHGRGRGGPTVTAILVAHSLREVAHSLREYATVPSRCVSIARTKPIYQNPKVAAIDRIREL